MTSGAGPGTPAPFRSLHRRAARAGRHELPDRGPGPELRDAIARRLPEAPRLTWRLSGTSDQPVCRPGEVDVAAHVRAVDAAGPLDGAGVRTALVRLFEEHLDRTRPLWRMDVLGRWPAAVWCWSGGCRAGASWPAARTG